MRRVRIGRVYLDLRGVDPAVAEAAARGLGPALERALEGRQPATRSTARRDGGALVTGSAPDARALAAAIAGRLANLTTEE